ncbi:MAG: UvrD-helicase domain-containing protein [Ilumatobacteraceae bacterium]
MRPSLLREQILAATSHHKLVYVDAGPGSGKTTILVERFGVVSGRCAVGGSGVLALSFTRAVTAELRARIVSRWGPQALTGASRVSTIDGELFRLLGWLLRHELVTWPGGLIELNGPLDSWVGTDGFGQVSDPRFTCYLPGFVDGVVGPAVAAL